MNNEFEFKDSGTVTEKDTKKVIDGLDGYTQVNRIPFLKNEYRKDMLKKFKDLFMQELYAASQEEKIACQKLNIEPSMQENTIKYVEDLVNASTDWFQLEALYNYIFIDNIVPTKNEVNTRAIKLNLNLGKID